jgi:hypothetical protein
MGYDGEVEGGRVERGERGSGYWQKLTSVICEILLSEAEGNPFKSAILL